MTKAGAKNSLFNWPIAEEISRVTAGILEAVERDHPDAVARLAKLLEVDTDTIHNLKAGKTKKVPATVIATVSAEYGAQYIQPYMALFECKAVEQNREEAINALPALTALVAKMAATARDGGQIDHQALAAMLPELREADGVISTLRARATELGMSA